MNELKYVELDFKRIIDEFETLLLELNNSKSLDESLSIIDSINTIRDEYFSMYWICYFRYNLNVKDEYYVKEESKFSEYDPIFNTLRLKYYEALCNSRFKDDIRKTIGNKVFEIASMEVGLINKESEKYFREEKELINSYSKLMGSLVVEFGGIKMSLTKLNVFINSKNRNIRVLAQKARQKCLEENEEQIDTILDDLIKVRNKIARVLGYSSYTSLSYILMKRIGYGRKEIENFRKEVLKYIVPYVLELSNNQKRELNTKELYYYDEYLLFKDGTSILTGDTNSMIDNVLKMFKKININLYNTFKMMADKNLMDLECRENKCGGGITTYIPKYKVPMIICNFIGASSDFNSLMHEFGHSFQLYSSRDLKYYENWWPTYDTCEIHSKTMELLTINHADMFMGNTAYKYKYEILVSLLKKICYISLIDEFQHILYDNENFTKKQRKEEFRKLEKKYMPWIKYDDNDYLERGNTYQKQVHIFAHPFYYIDYALAYSVSLQFYIKSLSDEKGTWNTFIDFCSLGGTYSFIETLKRNDLTSPFDKDYLKNIIDKINIKM